MNLYEVLGVDKAAPPEAVKRAYRRKAKEAHPDMPTGSPEKFAAVSTALRVLTNPKARANYDATGKIDEPAVDNRDATAMSLVMQAIDAVAIGMNPEASDLRGGATNLLREQVRQIEQQIKNLEKQAETFRRLGARWKAKGSKVNRISLAFIARAGDQERAVVQNAQQKEIVELAIAILADHEFEMEQPTAVVGGPAGFSSMMQFISSTNR